MNDYDKFDDYIKGLFDKDPKVPAELNWEEMDFDLPDTNEPNNKPDRKKYLGLLLLLFLATLTAVTIVYFNIDKEKITKNQHHTQTAEQFNDNNKTSNTSLSANNENIQKTSVADDTKKDTNHSKPVFSDKKIRSNPAIRITNSNPKTISIPQNSQEGMLPLSSNTPSVLLTTENSNLPDITNSKNNFVRVVSNNNTSEITTRIDNNSTVSDLTFSPKKETTLPQENTQLGIENLSTIPMGVLAADNEVELLPSPALSEMNYADKASNFHLEEVFVGYGLNHFNTKIEDSNILKSKVKAAVGNSIRAGARFRLNDNWQTNIQLKYDRYHSTFEHIHALDTFYRSDGNRLYRVYQYEETHHNNYTNTLGVQLGVERKWQLAKRLQLYAGLGITPTYALSASGKTTTETLIERLAFDNEVSRFAINGNLSAGIIVPINNSINIEAAYQYNRFLLNDIFINNGIQTNQQNNVSLIISYRLSK